MGHPPFYADEPSVTCQKILHWKKTFYIPKEAKLSHHAIDLINKLITDADVRLGRNGASEIKVHPFFNGFDWTSVRQRGQETLGSSGSQLGTSTAGAGSTFV